MLVPSTLRLRFVLAAALALAVAAAPAAQSAMERGEEAYREGQFAEAARLLDQAVEASPDDPEARYLLARVLYDPRNPDRDEGRAGREIDRAVALDPGNLVYLVAQLEVLRADSWNNVQEVLRARRRGRIARRILAIDSTNAFAHEELGVQAIADYYRFRNAIELPTAAFRSVIQTTDDQTAPELVPEFGIGGSVAAGLESEEVPFVPGALFADETGEDLDDRFDVNELRDRGHVVLELDRLARAAYERAHVHLEQALRADPRRRAVYDHFARLATISDRYDEIAPILDEMYVQFPEDAGMWLYTGLANHRLGRYEAAAVAFGEAFEFMDGATREAYTDLSLVLPPDEADVARADPEAFAERYWASRDPRFLNTVNERRTEHYARLTAAELLFASEDLGIPGWATERGRLYVRYGPPETDVVIEGGYGLVVEAFTGRDPAFADHEGFQALNRFNVWDYGDGVRFVFEDPNRNGRFRLYSPPADLYALPTSADVGAMDFVIRAREEVRERPERYAFRAPGRQVELPYRITAFKGDAGRTDLYVNYGIPVAESGTPSEGVQEDVDVTVRTGAFLIGPQRDLLVERRRTVYGLRGAQIVPFEETRLWTSTEAVSASPGDGYEVSLEFETASGQTSAVQRRGVDVPDFGGAGLRLSDVLLAYYVEEADRAEPGRVFRDGVSVQPAPWGVFGVGDPVYLYVEAYGLGMRGDRTDYEVEASLRPKDTSRGLRRLARRIFGGGGPAVSSAFEVQGDRADDTVYLFLDATGQAPGLYTLTVTVRDRVTGDEADRETDLLLE